MVRPRLEVADIFRRYGEDYRKKHGLAMSLQQHRVMRAIAICRTAPLGGHVDQCDSCGHQVISYNSCRNRHCPKCQSLAKAEWLEARRAELLPVDYYHVVFTLPDQLAPLALQNKKTVYDILFRAASQTLLTIGVDPKHLGAGIGFMAILHTWGQNLMHHPHLHCVVPGGGLSPDSQKWISSRPGFFLPVRVLSRLFRRLFLQQLQKAFDLGQLEFHGRIQRLHQSFEQLIEACRTIEWVVYSKPPFGGPEKVLDYLGRYTHRIAISNHRLLKMQDGKIIFTMKNYKAGGRQQTITLDAHEFIRRFLLHVLPNGFVRIRYYGLLANCHRSQKLLLCRKLLNIPEVDAMPGDTSSDAPEKQNWADLLLSLTGKHPLTCPKCQQGHLLRIQTLPPTQFPNHTRAPPGAA